MTNWNSKNNCVVWVDIPVADLDRAVAFYAAVLDNKVATETFDDVRFAVLDHEDGNGGCLVIQPDNISSTGALVYLNADGRIRDAVQKALQHGGTVVEDVHPIGPHGFRAVLNDTEGNRIALHSETDA